MPPHRWQPTRLPRPWDSPGKNTGVGCHVLLQCVKWKVKVKSLSRVWLLATPWTAAHQAPPSTGFSRQEYWSGVPSSSPNHCARHWKHKHVFPQFKWNGVSYSTQWLTNNPRFASLLSGPVVHTHFTPHFLFVKLSRRFGQSVLPNYLIRSEGRLIDNYSMSSNP